MALIHFVGAFPLIVKLQTSQSSVSSSTTDYYDHILTPEYGAEFLLERGADAGAVTDQGWTALHSAAR